MTGEPKSGDRLFQLIVADITLMLTLFGVIVVAWVTDDGPDGKKARRLLGTQMPWIIVSVCWAHQVNLLVGDYLKLGQHLDTIHRAVEIVKWFNNHGTALDLFRKEQAQTYPEHTRILALILPVLTRWTAHFHTVSRLLLLNTALRVCAMRHEEALLVCAGKRQDLIAKAREILDTINDETFWTELVRCVSGYFFLSQLRSLLKSGLCTE